MKNWFRYIEKMFSRSKHGSVSSTPFMHEPLEIEREMEQELTDWIGSLRMRRLFDWLRNQYILYLSKSTSDAEIDFLDLPSSKGFVIHLDRTDFEIQEMELLLHHLKKLVLELGYKSSVSDRRSFKKGEVIHSVLRHYLKPRIRPLGRDKSDQKYGNINIELVLKNDSPAQFLFSASTYSDHKYHEAKAFEELMFLIFNGKN